jgi:hypothetical protein
MLEQIPIAKVLQLWRDLLYGQFRSQRGAQIRAERPEKANPLNLIRIMPAEGLRAGFEAPSSFIR